MVGERRARKRVRTVCVSGREKRGASLNGPREKKIREERKMQNHVARFRTVRARRRHTKEGKNEVRLTTVGENHEVRKKMGHVACTKVPKEKTQREQKLRRDLEQQGDTREDKNVTRVRIEQQVRERYTRGAKKQARVKTVRARTHEKKRKLRRELKRCTRGRRRAN